MGQTPTALISSSEEAPGKASEAIGSNLVIACIQSNLTIIVINGYCIVCMAIVDENVV